MSSPVKRKLRFLPPVDQGNLGAFGIKRVHVDEQGRRCVEEPQAPPASFWMCGQEGCLERFRNLQGLRFHEKFCRGRGPVVPIGLLPDTQIISWEKRSFKGRRSSRCTTKLDKSQKMTKGNAKRTAWGVAKMAECIHLCDDVGAVEASKRMQIPYTNCYKWSSKERPERARILAAHGKQEVVRALGLRKSKAKKRLTYLFGGRKCPAWKMLT